MQLSPWPLVAAAFNLEVAEGMRQGPFISANEAKHMAARAIRKMKRELARQGVDAATIRHLFSLRDCGDSRQHANLAALLPPPTYARDDADPSQHRSLRAAR